ncbi:hypothetical protein V866_003146 [Kwoniella sp. B9012]|uniref:Uncharacterized protein n=1 Tax=Kwoniella europaea PYCC6329 TaxID=1423913 RepID=A0AAX4KHS8_9TREE
MIYNDLIRRSQSSGNDVNDNGKRGQGSTSSTIEDSVELHAQLAQNTLFATVPTFATIAVPTYSLSAIIPPISSGNDDNIVDIESMSFQFLNILGKYGEGTYLENDINLEEDASLISQALKGAFETASILRNYQNGEEGKNYRKSDLESILKRMTVTSYHGELTKPSDLLLYSGVKETSTENGDEDKGYKRRWNGLATSSAVPQSMDIGELKSIVDKSRLFKANLIREISKGEYTSIPQYVLDYYGEHDDDVDRYAHFILCEEIIEDIAKSKGL